ncbi:MAG: hypothetical protein KC423_19970, partial [Anaerolineales bacterium]|nr:hypothetical protein [Anaerolineales bacterium]
TGSKNPARHTLFHIGNPLASFEGHLFSNIEKTANCLSSRNSITVFFTPCIMTGPDDKAKNFLTLSAKGMHFAHCTGLGT